MVDIIDVLRQGYAQRHGFSVTWLCFPDGLPYQAVSTLVGQMVVYVKPFLKPYSAHKTLALQLALGKFLGSDWVVYLPLNCSYAN